MLIVMISRSRSGASSYSAKVESGGVSSRSVLIPISASRLGSVITTLAVGEGDGLAADREVAALRPADVVFGHQDPGQVRVAAEDDPEEVIGLALLGLGGREHLGHRVDLRQRVLARVAQH